MTIDLNELRSNALKLQSGASPIEDYCATHDEVLALIEVAEAATVALTWIENYPLSDRLDTKGAWRSVADSLDQALASFARAHTPTPEAAS